MVGMLTGTFTDFGTLGRAQDIDVLWAQQAFGKAGETWLLSVAPLLAILPLLGLGIGFAQGGVFSFKAMLHFDALNPLNGFKRLFSMQSVVGLGRSLAKVGLSGVSPCRASQAPRP